MKDRFKFRVWCKERKEWEKDQVAITNKENYIIDFSNQNFTRVTNIDPVQHEINFCTGLKDKNGKLIFEGDILKEKYFDSDKEQFEYAYLQIGYDEKWCSYYQQVIDYDYKEAFPEFDFKEENIEVIGNIYENPELLKGDFNE